MRKIFFFLFTFYFILSPVLFALAEEISSTGTTSTQTIEKSIEESQNSSSTQPNFEEVKNIEQRIETITSSTPEVKNETEPQVDSIPSVSFPQKDKQKEEILPYNKLMQGIIEAKQENSIEKKEQIISHFESFIDQEKGHLDKLEVDKEKQKNYFKRLKKQAQEIDNTEPTFFEKVKDFFVDIFEKNESIKPIDEEIKIPENPASVQFNDEEIKVNSIQDPQLKISPGQIIHKNLKKLITIETVNAIDNQFLPVIEDLHTDEEIVINEQIREIAKSLNNNPVEIVNFVRSHIMFEPYYGAKKGSLGCLSEKKCNDVDAASLTISLFRAVGIPARYKKSLATFRVEDLKNILGVEDTKTAYIAFALNRFPIAPTTLQVPVNIPIEQVDFNPETHFTIEWVFPEVFFEYDERGANINNDMFEIPTTTESLRDYINDFPKKQWIPLDVMVKKYQHTQRDILLERSNINVQNFWTEYFTYQGNQGPMEKFKADVFFATGQNIDNFFSTNISQTKSFSILPITLPFIPTVGGINGVPINEEIFSALPQSKKTQMRLTIAKQNGNIVLQKGFSTSKVNNKDINLFYEGATDADKQVIDSYGGIHLTPAELADIVPFFEIQGEKFLQNLLVPVNIGETLTLRFEMMLNNQFIQRDEKISIAGNSEGIYLMFSQLQNRGEFDTNSKILLGGNTALAWKYLKTIEEQREFLYKFLDYSSNIYFARAVVTQNRILNTLNGTPTTFDFKGLTIDAGVYLAADYSNRGSFAQHRLDFRLLLGLESSWQEGNLFKEVVGLEGISTIKGLQYAYSRPAEYTMHRINLDNRIVLDSLVLLPNRTKANMFADIRAGNTIITPNKPIRMGNWNGVLYISLSPNGSAKYAIGEQVVQNGGWTTSQMLRNVYINQSNQEKNGFLYNFGENHFYYEEGKNYDTVLCRITQAEYNLVTSRPDWNASFGYPCLIENKRFGDVDHSYILTSNGAYFFSPGRYDYWVWKENVKGVLLADKNVEAHEHLQNVRLDGEFKFNPIAGTYSWFGHFDGPFDDVGICRGCITSYYEPTQNRIGKGRLVYGDVLEKLTEQYYQPTVPLCNVNDQYCNKKNWILNILGYPTNNRSSASISFAETNGQYQAFIGGHIYRKTSGLNKTYYVPNAILTFYNSDVNVRNGQRGTGGNFGFPIADPYYLPETRELLQKFEWKMIQTINNNHNTVAYNDHERRMNSKEYGFKLHKKVLEGMLTDVEAFSLVVNYISYLNDSDVNFVKDLLVFYLGTDKITDYSKIPGDFEAYLPTFLWSDTGFKFKYNDSHYCTWDIDKELNEKEGYICISNQPHHAIAAFAAGYMLQDVARIPGRLNERDINPLGYNGYSVEDIDLTNKMILLGGSLKTGIITKDQVSRWILDNLAERDLVSKRIPIREIERIAEYRKNFRVFEYEQNGNIDGKWKYTQDIDKIVCGDGTQLYYQNYDYFYFNNAYRVNSRAILDQRNRKVLFLYGNSLMQYQNTNSLCQNFFQLSNEMGYTLHMYFNRNLNIQRAEFLIEYLKSERYNKPNFNNS